MDNYFNDYQKLKSSYNSIENTSSLNKKNNGTLVPLSKTFNSTLNCNSSSSDLETSSVIDEDSNFSFNTRSILGNKPISNFLGFELHSDDLIIVGLLLFLLLQENDDISLYIVLILLLLS